MGYQFVHLESFSRKADSKGRDTEFIFNEVSRKTEASVHVQKAAPPIVVHGLEIQALREMHDALADEAATSVQGGKMRKIRKDQKTLHTVVASHPLTMQEISSDPSGALRKEAERWELRTISWLEELYGADLKSVVRHEDESHYHLHAYVIPTSDPEMKAVKFHPGTLAKREIMAAGPKGDENAKSLSKRADAGYKGAMRHWQDSYHEAVAIPCGLTRLGPQRRRLSRDEWQREQVQAKALQQTLERAIKVKSSGEDFLARTESEAATIRSAIAKQRGYARRISIASVADVERAHKAQEAAAEAIRQLERYSGLGGRIRMLWDAVGKSNLANLIRQEFADEMTRILRISEFLKVRLKDEETRRREAEDKAQKAMQDAERARNVATRMQYERDRAWSLLPPEKRRELAAPKLSLRPSASGDRK